MSLSILASGAAGFAISYGLGQGVTLVAALWGVFVWKEFAKAPPGTSFLLAAMFASFVIGLSLIVYARVVWAAAMSAPVVIVGSLNMDFVVQVGKLPRPGETVVGSGFSTLPGGQGANQACAAGKIGGRARMVGRVGDDVFGAQLRDSLRAAGLDTGGVCATEATTGVALIFVQAGGQNEIVVASGANGRLTPTDVREELESAPPGLLLLQLESPLETVEQAAALGRKRRMSVVLDPASARRGTRTRRLRMQPSTVARSKRQ